MAISAEFTVNGNINPAAHAVAYGASVTLVLQSATGANSIVWEFMGSSKADVVYPTISLSGAPTGQTATFSMVADPGDTLGRSLIVQCTVTDSNGNQARQSAVIGVLNVNSLLPIGATETFERSHTHGWAPEVNKALASAGGGGGGYNLVQDEGSSVTVRTTLNFAGAGVTVTDSGGKTLVTIPGGSSLTAPANPADDGKVAIASGGNLSYALLANANITNATIALAKMAAIAALSVVGNATNASAVPTAIAGTDGQALRVSGTTLGFGTLATAAYTDASVTYAKIANGTGLSVIGRSANTGGVNADIVAVTDGHALRLNGTTLGFGTLASGAFAAGTIALTALATQAALSIVGNGTNATASPTALVAGTDGNIVRRSGTAVAFGSIDLSLAGAVGTSKLAYANLADLTGLSVLARSTNSSGVMAAVTGTANQVLVVNGAGTSLGFGSIDLSQSATVGSSKLAFANFTDGSARSVFGRAANSSGVQASIAAAGAGQVLIDNGTTVGFGTLVAASFAAATVPLTALATQASLSIVGNGTNASASPTALAAATDGDVMRRSGTSIGFGAPNFAAQNITTTGVISLGTTPASAGTVRIPNASDIRARNAANSADQILVSIDSSNTIGVGDVAGTGVRMTTAGVIGGRIGGTDAITLTSTLLAVPAGAVGIGTNPASNGEVRLPSQATIRFRNNANSADVIGLSISSTDVITLGNSAGNSVLLASTTVLLRPNGTDRVAITDTITELRHSTFQFDTAVTTPAIIHEDNTTNSATAQPLIVAAQNATGTTATGGILDLRSGTGTTAPGTITLRNGATVALTISTTSLTSSVANLRWNSAVVTPAVFQDDETAASATGDTFTVAAQDCTGTTSVTAGAMAIRAGNATGASGTRNGGAITISSGTGATADGDLTLKRGAATRFSATSTATTVADASTFVGFEHAFLASARDVTVLNKATPITTTEMPTNSGHGVTYIAAATTAPTASPVGGLTMWSSSAGALVTRDTSGVMTLGDSANLDMTLKAQSVNGLKVNIGGTDYLQYVGSGQGLIFLASTDSIVCGGAGVAQVMSFTAPAGSGSANISFFQPGSYGSGKGIFFINNMTTAPSSNPSGGGFMWVEAGALKYRGSSGTVSTVAPA